MRLVIGLIGFFGGIGLMFAGSPVYGILTWFFSWVTCVFLKMLNPDNDKASNIILFPFACVWLFGICLGIKDGCYDARNNGSPHNEMSVADQNPTIEEIRQHPVTPVK